MSPAMVSILAGLILGAASCLVIATVIALGA